MDTSDSLASGLSLVAFLLVFVYLSLVEWDISTGSLPIWPSEQFSRLLITLHLLRLAVVVAVVISTLSLILGQGSPGLAVIIGVALALLAFLIATDRVAHVVSIRFPGMTSNLASPLRTLLLRFLKASRPGEITPEEAETGYGRDNNGAGPEIPDSTTVVITEEGPARLDARERTMIRSILRFNESVAREIMVPRVDIVAVEAGTPLTEVASRMLDGGHSRLPVYSETIDNILGVVHSRDLLPFLSQIGNYPPLESIIRPAFFIPESKRLDELLRELQERREQMAMAVDEYGGIEGLLTFEDLLEEIVGEIEDEFSRGLEPPVTPLANGDIVVDARVTLDYLSDLFSTQIETEDVDTIGGLVYSALGKIPRVGDEVVHNDLRIEVVSLLGRRIRRLKLSRTEPREGE